MNKNESRFFNTANKMHDALIQLLDIKDFEFITVREICTHAGVNRSTFYLHYDNTYDLLAETVEAVYKDFFSRYKFSESAGTFDIDKKESQELFLITPEYMYPYLNFVRENRRLFRLMYQKSRTLGTEKMYGHLFEKIFSPILDKFGVSNDQQSYIMTFYLKGLIGLIDQWVNDDCRMPNELLMEVIDKCIIKP